MSLRRDAVVHVATGVVAVAAILWLFLWGTVATIQVITLLAVVVAFIWFATVEVSRLRNPGTGGLHPQLFALAAVGLALLIVGVVFVGTVTSYLQLAVGVGAVVVGLTRSLGRASA